MKSLLDQLKNRRIQLKLKQHDMLLRVGISRKQYQRLESKGNPRLDTPELIAKGLNSEILLIPQEKLQAAKAVLEGKMSVGKDWAPYTKRAYRMTPGKACWAMTNEYGEQQIAAMK